MLKKTNKKLLTRNLNLDTTTIMSLLIDDHFCSISPKGDVAAWCTADGVIKFYDCLTGAVKHEYSSSSHLKGACTSLHWSRSSPTATQANVKSQKKVKTSSTSSSSNRNDLKDVCLVAIGTSEGSILVYDLAKASLFTLLVSFQEHHLNSKIKIKFLLVLLWSMTIQWLLDWTTCIWT